MLEQSVKQHAFEKYAGDESKVAEFMEGFKEQLEKKAAESPFGHASFEGFGGKTGPSLHEDLSKGLIGAVGKGLGGLAVGMGIAGISKAFSSANNSALHTKFLSALERAIASNSILRDADKGHVTQYADTIFKFAPNVATDSNLLSSILANAVHGSGIDPMTIKLLGDLEGRYIENSSAGNFSPKTFV